MERRKFLQNGGLLGALLGGAGTAAAMAQPTAPAVVLPPVVLPKEDISHLAPPSGATTIQINGSYLTDEETQREAMRIGSDGSMGIGTSPYTIRPWSSPTTHSVTMTVGKDNRLWMKVGDTWHRVALES
jgi:hypothetical protein